MTSNNALLLIGGGGHCRSCVDVIREEGKWPIAGIVESDDVVKPQPCLGVNVIGFDRDLPELLKRTPYCLITVGQVKSADLRASIFQRLITLGAKFPTIISPHSYVSPSATLGQGTIIMHQALVNAQAQIGQNVIINSQALVEHDAVIGDHCHLSTGAKVNGGVQIGSGCLIGSGSIVKQGVTIADNVIIGAGSLVLSDIEQPGVYTGVIK
jgi:sugar O-acyltransferase (sialic acid O-acetyltransferase NeuD family)